MEFALIQANLIDSGYCRKYIQNNSNERKVIDFIAGMTDALFHKEIERD